MGVITLPWSMEQDRENQIKANSVHVDDNFNTLLNATNGKLEADGSITPTADLPMGSHKITGLATPTLNGDAATKGYVDSRDSTLDATYVKLTGAQTVAGVKTFSSSPIVPTPTTDMQASTKKYVDDNIISAGSSAFVKLTGNQTIAGTKTFSGTIVANNKITGSISGNCDGNAGTVTNGVYTSGNQTIGGTKTFSASPLVPNVGTMTDNSQKAASTKFVLDILKTVYPKNSVYFGTTTTCPLAALFGTWEKIGTSIVTSVSSTVNVITSATNHIGGTEPMKLGQVETDVSVNRGSGYPICSYGDNGIGSNGAGGSWGSQHEKLAPINLVANTGKTTLTVNIWKRTA